MAIYFVPLKPNSGERGTYNRLPGCAYFPFTTVPFDWIWGYSTGTGSPTVFPPVRMVVFGEDENVPVFRSDPVQAVSGQYIFTVDLPDGQYLATFEGTGVEVLEKAFSVNASGQALPDAYCWTAGTRFERTYAQVPMGARAKVIFPGNLYAPKIFPLKPRLADPYSTFTDAKDLWVRHMQTNTHGAQTRQWVRDKSGSLLLEPAQKYFYSSASSLGPRLGKPPSQPLRDGPRGVGNLGYLYDMHVSPADAGVYFSDVLGRIGFMWLDGRVLTLAGWRVKAGEIRRAAGILNHNPLTAEDQAVYDSAWEMVGDWSQVPEPKEFRELWGIVPLYLGPDEGHHEFWVADTLNNRILYLNHYTAHGESNYHKPMYPPPGYVAPDAPTGQTQIFVFEAGLNQPWGVRIQEIDGIKWLYWTEFAGNQILRKRLDGSGGKEVVVDSAKKPTNQEMGIPAEPPFRLSGSTWPLSTVRAAYLIDGPLGTATCVRPQAIGFDSTGRLIWCERYTNALRCLENGVVRTLALLPFPLKINPDTGQPYSDTVPWGVHDWSMAIDSKGECGPVDDIFVRGWWQADKRFDRDGNPRAKGNILNVTGGVLTNGPAEWCNVPGYGWGIGIGHGRIFMQGSAAAWQMIEITRRKPTDPVIDRLRAQAGDEAFRAAGLALTHGPAGQGEIGYPNIEEMASWDNAGADQPRPVLEAYLSGLGIQETQFPAINYYIWASTVDHDLSGAEPPPPPPPPDPVDCELSAWSEWSEWMPVSGDPDLEMRTRTRDIVTAPMHGGEPCGPLEETETRKALPALPTKEEALAGLEVARRYIEG